MDITKIGLPIQFQRTTPNALDSTSVVSTTTELNNLSAAATSYLGMQVFNVENQTLYVLITSSTNSDPHFYALGGNNSSAGQEASTQLQTVSSDLATQITTAQTTAYNNLTSLSSDVFGAVGEALAQQISALSAFDTITELAAAVDSLSTYKTSNNFLSASSPTITTGDLTLADGFGIKTDDGTTVIDSSRNVIATALYVGTDTNSTLKIDSTGIFAAADYYIKTDGAAKVGALTATSLDLASGSYKIESNGNATLANTTVTDLTISGGTYKIESDGDATLRDLTVSSIYNAGSLSAAAGKFVVDGSGNVTVGVIGGTEANLTVTGNLSVLGTTTYLDTNVTTMSAVVAELNSDSATTLAVKQTGNYAIATFANNSGVQLTVSNSGSLSAAQAATFDSTVNVGGKLTVNADISSSQTVYASAGLFSSSLEVGNQADDTVLYVNASGVGINTETLDGYSLKVSGDANSGNGTLYVAGSATLNSNIAVTGPAVFSSTVSVLSSTSVVELTGSGSTRACSLTGDTQVVTWGSMWSYISALDGGSF